jgi:hypothetical protein
LGAFNLRTDKRNFRTGEGGLFGSRVKIDTPTSMSKAAVTAQASRVNEYVGRLVGGKWGALCHGIWTGRIRFDGTALGCFDLAAAQSAAALEFSRLCDGGDSKKKLKQRVQSALWISV